VTKKPRLFPIVNADVALFTLDALRLRVLLIQRANKPDPGGWALPGGLLDPTIDQSLDDTALRVLANKTRVALPYLEQVTTHSGPDRDPRGWSVSILYYALLPSDQLPAVAGSKTEAIEWCDPDRPGHRLGFDHTSMLAKALATLRHKVTAGSLPLHLMPAQFTLTDLQRACEAILGQDLDKGAFRRQIKDAPSLATVPGAFLRGAQRPAQLYRVAHGFKF
jgi:8-oxo-dGTP diphosphatase